MLLRILLPIMGLSSWLLGCASGTSFQPVEARADLALVYIYRIQNVGLANRPAVKINGRQVSNLRPDGYSAHLVHPGKIVISAASTQFVDEKQSSVTIDADAGATYYVRGKLGFGRFAGAPVLTLVDEEVGATEIRRCKLIE